MGPTADNSAERARSELPQPLLSYSVRQHAHHGECVADLRRELKGRDAALATAAHELRNCLGPVRNSLEILLHATDESTRAVAGAIARRQLATMTALVQDLLEASRFTCGQVNLEPRRLPLQDVIRQAVQDCRGDIDARRQSLSCRLPREPLWIEADAMRLVQVFTNLLGNAAKFTHPGGHIRVLAAREGLTARVRIKDDGVGIAPTELGRIFGLFQQERRTAGAAPAGLGIGLAVVRRLVELHGGSVHARSRGTDLGSTFDVRLPLAPA